MLSSSLTHSIIRAYHIMPHNQTQYYRTLLISIPLKATGIDPSYTMHQLSYLAQPKQPKLHNNSQERPQVCPYAYCPCSYAYCPRLAKSIRVLAIPIRVCYAYHFPIRVPPETISRSKFHLFHSYAYGIHHTRTTPGIRVSHAYGAYQRQNPFF